MLLRPFASPVNSSRLQASTPSTDAYKPRACALRSSRKLSFSHTFFTFLFLFLLLKIIETMIAAETCRLSAILSVATPSHPE